MPSQTNGKRSTTVTLLDDDKSHAGGSVRGRVGTLPWVIRESSSLRRRPSGEGEGGTWQREDLVQGDQRVLSFVGLELSTQVSRSQKD